MIACASIDSPLGVMVAGATNDGICLFDFVDRDNIDGIKHRIEAHLQDRFEDGMHVMFELLRVQVQEYFAGVRQQFDLPLLMAGTHFQCSVWSALRDIPYGSTRSYAQQSQMLGNVNGIRAVARANGENGLAIIVPCHRVIGANGNLTGYSGGLHRKQWLLNHEQFVSGKLRQGVLF